jgi:uncharacterized protein YciI
MAQWICIFDDSPGMLAIRTERRARHHAFLSENAATILNAGALCPGETEPPTGALWVLDVEHREDAVRLIERDPYYEPQHRRYRLFRWKPALSTAGGP